MRELLDAASVTWEWMVAHPFEGVMLTLGVVFGAVIAGTFMSIPICGDNDEPRGKR
jgi:hypothetical protein